MLHILYFSTGLVKNSKKMTENLLIRYDKKFIQLCNDFFVNAQKKHSEEKLVSVFYDRELSTGYDLNFQLKLSYKPFEGHISRLGHYYRHLYPSVKYVTEQPDELIENKYEYLKTMRAQLSSHEQLLLYYNALTDMGNPWIKNKFLTDYRFIKNIPLPMADIGIPPKERLGTKNSKGEYIFEWDEVVT